MDTKRKHSGLKLHSFTGIEEQQDRGGSGPRPERVSPQFRRPVLSLQPDQRLPVQPGRSQRTLESWLSPALPSAPPQIGRDPGDMRTASVTFPLFIFL